MAVTPVDAVTIILLRKAEGKETKGFEVLMVLRSSKSTFVPSAYVFPGGKVEEEDCLPVMENFCNKNDLMRAQSVLDSVSLPQRALGIWVAAIRETFEEVGLPLARQKDGTLLSFDLGYMEQRLRSYRERVNSGDLDFVDLLQREELTLAVERLHYFSHWITPELSPFRYDTRFFVAEVPWNQKVFHDGDELTRHVWITPAKALERYREKKFYMVVPTIVTLEELSCFETIGDVIESTRGKNVTGIMTLLVFENDEVQEHTPDGRIFRNLIPSA
jgi:8-oxo-dGTP pyrophosphatase MutT (NUDIX family)